MALALDVMPLIAGALLEERHFWRETAACHISSLVVALAGDRRMHCRPIVPRSALRQELRETVESLRAAFAGDFFPICEACGEAVRPGDATLRDVDCGDLHADCCAAESQQPVKPGDKVFLDPESIVVEEGEAPRDHIHAGVAANLLTDAEIAERLVVGVRALEAGASVAETFRELAASAAPKRVGAFAGLTLTTSNRRS